MLLLGIDGYEAGESNRVTSYDYDLDGRIELIASPEGQIEYEYDPATGRLTRTLTDHTDTLYGYDELGRLKSVSSQKLNGQTPPTPQLVQDRYDANGEGVRSWRRFGGEVRDHKSDGRRAGVT